MLGRVFVPRTQGTTPTVSQMKGVKEDRTVLGTKMMTIPVIVEVAKDVLKGLVPKGIAKKERTPDTMEDVIFVSEGRWR